MRIDGEALLSCACGHDIGGEHNSRGCYGTVGYGTQEQRRCTCPLTDGQDVPELLAMRVERMVAAARSEALRDTADRWTQGAWSEVMLPKPTPPAVPVIAYANRVGDWLRDRADREEQP